MAVAALTAFPASFIAGDTLRVDLSDADYPASAWSLKVHFDGPSQVTFDAEADGDDFELEADTAVLSPGSYKITLVYTETATSERASISFGFIQILQDPLGEVTKSIAQETLELMEAALKSLAAGTLASANFNGQSFTKRNIKELQDAVGVQRGVVRSEQSASEVATGIKRPGIFTRFA